MLRSLNCSSPTWPRAATVSCADSAGIISCRPPKRSVHRNGEQEARYLEPRSECSPRTCISCISSLRNISMVPPLNILLIICPEGYTQFARNPRSNLSMLAICRYLRIHHVKSFGRTDWRRNERMICQRAVDDIVQRTQICHRAI